MTNEGLSLTIQLVGLMMVLLQGMHLGRRFLSPMFSCATILWRKTWTQWHQVIASRPLLC